MTTELNLVSENNNLYHSETLFHRYFSVLLLSFMVHKDSPFNFLPHRFLVKYVKRLLKACSLPTLLPFKKKQLDPTNTCQDRSGTPAVCCHYFHCCNFALSVCDTEALKAKQSIVAWHVYSLVRL